MVRVTCYDSWFGAQPWLVQNPQKPHDVGRSDMSRSLKAEHRAHSFEYPPAPQGDWPRANETCRKLSFSSASTSLGHPTPANLSCLSKPSLNQQSSKGKLNLDGVNPANVWEMHAYCHMPLRVFRCLLQNKSELWPARHCSDFCNME